MIEYIYRGTRDRSFGRRPICGFLKVFAVPHHGPTHPYWFSELRKINFDEYMIGNIFTEIRGHWFFSRPICSWFFCRPTHPGRGDEMTWVLNKFHTNIMAFPCKCKMLNPRRICRGGLYHMTYVRTMHVPCGSRKGLANVALRLC